MSKFIEFGRVIPNPAGTTPLMLLYVIVIEDRFCSCVTDVATVLPSVVRLSILIESKFESWLVTEGI